MSRAQHLATINRELHPQSTKLAVIDRALAGMSYSQISEDLGVPRGVVSGIVYRARQNGEMFPNQRSADRPPPDTRYVRKVKVIAPKPRQVAPEVSATWFPKRLSIMQLRETSCRWPLWANDAGPKDRFYCGLDAAPGRPYCHHCEGLAVVPRRTDSFDKKHGIFKLTRRVR